MTDADPTPVPLLDEAMKKASVIWVAVDGAAAHAVWCLPLEGALYVVSGPGEQSAPGLAEAASAVVTMRGDHGGRIVSWPARVSRVTPDGGQWETVAPQVATKRLNSPLPAAELVERWAAECVLSRLTPGGEPLAAGETLPDDSHAGPPRETTATRPARRPFRLHRVRRR